MVLRNHHRQRAGEKGRRAPPGRTRRHRHEQVVGAGAAVSVAVAVAVAVVGAAASKAGIGTDLGAGTGAGPSFWWWALGGEACRRTTGGVRMHAGRTGCAVRGRSLNAHRQARQRRRRARRRTRAAEKRARSAWGAEEAGEVVVV